MIAMPPTAPPHLAHQYDALFYRYQREGSLRSARVVLPMVANACAINSILDIGCGAGAWLSVANAIGLQDIAGVDGNYVDRSLLLFDPASFTPYDISKLFEMGRKFDLVQCMEVAEHVPEAYATTLVRNIVHHGRLVIFSAAVPGQGGENHINEQPYEYWRNLFSLHGYRLFDFVRPRTIKNRDVEPWYRYNLLLFAHDSVIHRLPNEVAITRVPDHDRIRDYSPPVYRLRKAILRQLPNTFVDKLATWKHQRSVRALKPDNGD